MDKKDLLSDILSKAHFTITAFFYSVIFSGAVFGVFGIYRSMYVMPAVVLLIIGMTFLSNKYLPGSTGIKRKNAFSKWELASEYVIFSVTLLLIVTLIVIPIARWPESIAGDWFPWDAGKYHFPKAVELFRTGSSNDMSIAYSEYPFGYESLLSFCLLLTGDASLFGWMHALIDIFFLLSFWMLAKRFTQMRSARLLFLVTCVSLSNYLFQFLNLWQVFQPELHTVGKNDLLLAASILAFLSFYPFPRFKDASGDMIFPTAAAGMIALSVKPNAAYILAPLWSILGGYILWEMVKKKNGEPQFSMQKAIISSMLMVPGLLWLIRNLLFSGVVFSDYVLEASKWSIAANLTNPFFYNFIPKNLYLIIVIILIMIILSLKKAPNFLWFSGVLILFLVGFIFTPVSGFFRNTDVPASINWRFGQAMLAYVFICVLVIIKYLVNFEKINEKVSFHREILVVLIVCSITAVLLIPNSSVASRKTENKIILTDQFREPVGVDGYYSAYDYVQRNIRNSTVWVENGLPYYVYGPGYTNTVSREGSADYIVLIKTDWFGDGGKELPSYFNPETWQKSFSILYEDPQGIVFIRNK